ncbi:hypothetical protein [Methylocystis heyeri]|uniref:hypothetical protein n=1 Tax=Methylocystis heyeri TaxID=391905 RepID=UPI001FE2C46A|nr:hypothetical protein [Methylocystis heyeri]
MQEDIGGAVVGHNETIAFGYVEPLDRAGDFDKIESGFIAFRKRGGQTKLILKIGFYSQLTNPPADPALAGAAEKSAASWPNRRCADESLK